jgi:hypothetical protein
MSCLRKKSGKRYTKRKKEVENRTKLNKIYEIMKTIKKENIVKKKIVNINEKKRIAKK